MTVLVNVFQTLVGLFVEDGSLALAITAIVLLSGIIAILLPDMPLAALAFGRLSWRAFRQCHESSAEINHVKGQ